MKKLKKSKYHRRRRILFRALKKISQYSLDEYSGWLTPSEIIRLRWAGVGNLTFADNYCYFEIVARYRLGISNPIFCYMTLNKKLREKKDRVDENKSKGGG